MVDELDGWNWNAPENINNGENMLDWAIHYLDLGWNIMPIEAAGKKPRLYKWEHLNSESSTPEIVDKWWGEQWPHANIGLICGKISGVVVLDVDNAKKMPSYPIPITAQSRTSRGFHYFFKYPAQGCSSFKGDGFDLQSDGKYVVLPPSEHSSGKFYEWIVDPWHELDPFSDLPEWLLEGTSMSRATGEAGGIIAPLFSMESYFEGVAVGGRNNAAARLAGYLFSNGRELEEVLCTLFGWNLKNPQPLSSREIKTVVESVYRKHQRKR